MKHNSLFGIALTALASLSWATQSHALHSEQTDGIPGSIHHYESVAMMSAATASGHGGSKEPLVELAFQTLGREFDVQLEPSDVFASGARVVWIDDAGQVVEPVQDSGSYYKGRLQDDPNSWVRLHITDAGELAGMVVTPEEVYFLEPAPHYFGAATTGQTLAYRLSETDSEWQPGSCAADERPSFWRAPANGVPTKPSVRKGFAGAHALFERVALGAVAAPDTSIKRAQIALVADYEYFQEHGANSATDLATIMNAVDGIYQSEVGVTTQVLTTIVYSTVNDPFDSTTDYNSLLNQLSTLHDANDNNPGDLFYGADLIHLVTNRDLNSTVIGLAWIDALCDSYYGSGLSQDFSPSLYNMTLLLAHEIGHNFAAPHDAQAGSPCVDAPATFIMNPVLSSSLQQKFSDCSKSFMNPAIAAAACFDSVTQGPTPTPTNTALVTNTPTRTSPPQSTPTSTGTATRTPTRTRTATPGGIGVPTITGPAAGQVVGVEGVSFAWTSVGAATAYDIRVLNAANNATVFTGSLTGGASTSTLISLPNNGNYSFRVRACVDVISDATCGGFAARNFTVALVAPSAAPVITAPSPGANLTSSTYTLSWTAVDGNPAIADLFYDVQLTNLATGQGELQVRTFAPTTQLSTTLRTGSYRMVVRACQAACGPASASVDFTVALASVPTGKPTITSATVDGNNLLSAQWTAVSGAAWYQLQVVQPPPAGPGGGALTVAARQVTGTSATTPVPVGQAFVLVSACNGDGCGPSSGVAQINPSGPNPASPQVGVPIPDSVVPGPSVLFAWSRIPGDDGNNTTYRVYVQDLSRQTAALDVLTTQDFFGALLKAEGSRYAVVVIANPGTPSEVQGPGVAFTVQGSSAVAPTLIAPTYDSTIPAGNVLMAWSPVPGATLYEYFVAIQGEPNASGRGVTPGLFVQVPLPAVNGQPTVYSGIVRACPLGATCVGGSDSGWGPWSNVAGTGGINFTVTP